MIEITKAEAELDHLTQQRMRKTGESYAVAASRVLEARPEIYQRYCEEISAGPSNTVRAPQFVAGPIGKADDDDDDLAECPECEEEIPAGSKFCPECGKKLKR